MTPTKQTVYLPVEAFNETTVIVTNQGANTLLDKVKQQEGYFFTPEQLNEYTANVVRQALETAAENTDIIWIDKQPITNTFEESYKKFEV